MTKGEVERVTVNDPISKYPTTTGSWWWWVVCDSSCHFFGPETPVCQDTSLGSRQGIFETFKLLQGTLPLEKLGI